MCRLSLDVDASAAEATNTHVVFKNDQLVPAVMVLTFALSPPGACNLDGLAVNIQLIGEHRVIAGQVFTDQAKQVAMGRSFLNERHQHVGAAGQGQFNVTEWQQGGSDAVAKVDCGWGLGHWFSPVCRKCRHLLW